MSTTPLAMNAPAQTTTVTPTTTSPAGSLVGFSFKTLVLNNKTGLKVVVGALGGYLTYLAGAVHDPQLNALASAAAGFVVKFGLDALDFWLTDVTIPTPKT
jgi:hypothetical protein